MRCPQWVAGGRARRSVGVFGCTMLLLAFRSSVAGADEPPPWQPIVDAVASGSAVPDPGSAVPDSGSAVPDVIAVPTGSADLAMTLRLGPDQVATSGEPLNTEGVDTAAEPEPAGEIAIPGVDTGTALTACAGSAALGSAGLLAGLATASGLGSGLIGPGSNAGGSSIAAVVILSGSGMGSVVVASGSGLGSAMTGSAAGGSAALGSAALGSAVLTCLLALPTPPPPSFNPLQLAPPPVLLPPLAPVAAPVSPHVPAVPPSPGVAPVPSATSAPTPTEPAPWGVLEMMILLVVSVITIQTVTMIRPTTTMDRDRK